MAHKHKAAHGGTPKPDSAKPESGATPETGSAATDAAPEPATAPAEPGAAAQGSAEAGGELEALRERQLRLAAEFDNYRKRTERERAETWTRAQAQLVEQLLDPLDDLHRVLAVDAEATTAQALLEGMQMVERKLLRVLQAAGLEAIDAHGQPFDPSEHEALMAAPTEHEHEDNSVGMVFQTGYRFKGTLLRPARVQVKKFDG